MPSSFVVLLLLLLLLSSAICRLHLLRHWSEKMAQKRDCSEASIAPQDRCLQLVHTWHFWHLRYADLTSGFLLTAFRLRL